MGIGKYSPTVSASYMLDQKWWERNGGGYGNGKNPDSDNDDDGFDSYGYADLTGPDRAGYTENDYMVGSYDEESDVYSHDLYDSIAGEWRGKLLGDLPDYVWANDIAKGLGISPRVIRIFHGDIIPKDIRVIYRSTFGGVDFAVHKDDVARIKIKTSLKGLMDRMSKGDNK